MSIAGHHANLILSYRRRGLRPRRPRRRDRHRSAAVAADSAASRGDVTLVMLVGAVCGIYFGLANGWQIAVESSQAVAGIIAYPAGNPFYMYHLKAWTLLHQVPALLLAGGVSEQSLSLAIGCLIAILSLQALALCGYAFSRDRWTACAMPVVYISTRLFEECGAVYQIHIVSDEYWTTYGVMGTAYTLFGWSLFGVGWKRPAAFLCGLAPAVHPALGVWCIAMATVAWAFQGRAERARQASLGRWFAAGAALTAISLAAQQYLARGLPTADPVFSRQLLEAFVEGWDNHRFPVPLEHIEWQLGWCALLLASVARAWFADDFSPDARLLLSILLASALAGVALLSLTHASHWLPLALVMAMPGRFINVAVAAFPALLIGMLARWRRVALIDGLLAGLAVVCFLRSLTVLRQTIYVPAAPKFFIAAGLALIYVLSCRRRQATGSRLAQYTAYAALACFFPAGFLWRRDWHLAAIVWSAGPLLWWMEGEFRKQRFIFSQSWRWLGQSLARTETAMHKHTAAKRCPGGGVTTGARPSSILVWPRAASLSCLWLAVMLATGPWLALACLGLLACWPARRWLLDRKFGRASFVASAALCVALIAAILTDRAREGYGILSDPYRASAFAAAAARPGAILTAPRMGGVQLRTRRPVILNGEALNQITYVPTSGPAINRILNRIYGDDLRRLRPADWIKLGGLMRNSGYVLWHEREPEEWRELAREFGFTDVLAYGDWNLKLPVVARAKKLTLYRVP